MVRLLAKGANPLTTRARGLAKEASALAQCVYFVNLLWCPAIKGMIVALSAVLLRIKSKNRLPVAGFSGLK